MCAVPTVDIGSESDHLRLTRDANDAAVDYLAAEVHADGLSASRSVYGGLGWGDLVAFFDQMVTDWRGWDGARTWRSLEGDLTIGARHQHGHVQLRVTLRYPGQGRGRQDWFATADLTLEPGEQLSRTATDLAALVKPWSPN
jgi:Family of unknown function (DUF6228)